MIDKLRFWLSFKLLVLGIKVCPDEHSRRWLKYGMNVAGTGIEKDLMNDESI